MYKGEFVGKNAESQTKRILILGESHHWEKKDWELQPGETEAQAEERRKNKEEVYKTENVLKCYLENYAERKGRYKVYRFFDYIVRSFGVDPELHREDFWSKVYFGNYVEKLCGVRDTQAETAIRETSEEYNRSLFQFIKCNNIDYVFCFSRRVYAALPSLEGKDSRNEKDGIDTHRLEHCTYHPGLQKSTNIVLDRPVTIYGLRHTSQGYSYRKYQERIAKIAKENKLPF